MVRNIDLSLSNDSHHPQDGADRLHHNMDKPPVAVLAGHAPAHKFAWLARHPDNLFGSPHDPLCFEYRHVALGSPLLGVRYLPTDPGTRHDEGLQVVSGLFQIRITAPIYALS